MATPSIALSVARPEFGRYIGAYLGAFTTTTAILAGDDVISTELREAGYTDDEVLQDAYFLGTEGSNLGEIRRIESYEGLTGNMRLSHSVVAENAVTTFEVYKYDPTMLRDALNDAAQQQYPALHKRVIDRSITPHPSQTVYSLPSTITNVRQVWLEPRFAAKTFNDNIAKDLNVDLEELVATDWTADTATLADEAETSSPDNFRVFSGSNAGKMTVASGATGHAYLTIPSPTNYAGVELNLSIWVYVANLNSTSRVNAAIRTDAGTWTVGTAHAGNGFEKLTVSLTDHTIATSIDVGIEMDAVGADQVCYFDELIVTAGPTDPIGSYGAPLFDWRSQGGSIQLPQGLNSSNQVALVGTAPLESFTSTTSTMSLNRGPQANRLYAAAAMMFFQQEIDQLGTDELNAAQRRETHYRNIVNGPVGHMAMPSLLKAPVSR